MIKQRHRAKKRKNSHFDSPLLPQKITEEYTGYCRKLWFAVLMRGVVDIVNSRKRAKVKFVDRATGEIKWHEDWADRWLGSEDFELACELAGVEPITIYRVTAKLILKKGLATENRYYAAMRSEEYGACYGG